MDRRRKRRRCVKGAPCRLVVQCINQRPCVQHKTAAGGRRSFVAAQQGCATSYAPRATTGTNRGTNVGRDHSHNEAVCGKHVASGCSCGRRRDGIWVAPCAGVAITTPAVSAAPSDGREVSDRLSSPRHVRPSGREHVRHSCGQERHRRSSEACGRLSARLTGCGSVPRALVLVRGDEALSAVLPAIAEQRGGGGGGRHARRADTNGT